MSMQTKKNNRSPIQQKSEGSFFGASPKTPFFAGNQSAKPFFSPAIQRKKNTNAELASNNEDYEGVSERGVGEAEMGHLTGTQKMINANEQKVGREGLDLKIETQIIEWHRKITAAIEGDFGSVDKIENYMSEEEAIDRGKEILYKISYVRNNSRDGGSFDFNSEQDLFNEVLFRLSVIQHMAVANSKNGFARYPVGGEGFDMRNEENWHMTDKKVSPTEQGDIIHPWGFEKNKGITPAEAMNQLYSQKGGFHERIIVDCSTLLGIIYYRAAQEMMGDDKFNSYYEQAPMTMGQLEEKFSTSDRVKTAKDPNNLTRKEKRDHTIKEDMKMVFISSLNELVPGDKVFFKNHPDYKTYGGGVWNGEYAVYMGKGIFEGFGARESYQNMIKKLWKATIKNRRKAFRKDKAAKKKYKRRGKKINDKTHLQDGRYLGGRPGISTEVYRFDFQSVNNNKKNR